MGGRESSEDYLEAILVIRRLRGSCRNVDIAERMGVAKPSVTKALGNLARRGLAVAPGAEKAPKLAAAIKAWESQVDALDRGEITPEEYESWKREFGGC